MNLEILDWNIKIVFGFSFRIIWKIMQIKEDVVVSLSSYCCFPVKVIAGKQNANLQSYFWCVWSAPLCILYSEVFAKSVHILGISLFCQPICMICGREGPGVEIKVHLMSSLESHECKLPTHATIFVRFATQTHVFLVYAWRFVR